MVKDDLKTFVVQKAAYSAEMGVALYGQTPLPGNPGEQGVRYAAADLISIGFDAFCRTQFNPQNLILLASALDYLHSSYDNVRDISSSALVDQFLKAKGTQTKEWHPRLIQLSRRYGSEGMTSDIGSAFLQILNALIKADGRLSPKETRLLRGYEKNLLSIW